MIYVPIILALFGLGFMAYKRSWVLKQDTGNEKMNIISNHIYEGALAFLNAEYRLLLIFVIFAAIALGVIAYIVPTTHWFIVPAFIFGGVSSALAGNMGMRLGVASLAVFGLSLLFTLLVGYFIGDTGFTVDKMTLVLESLAGFSLGSESIALFARLGGGIYTKAADVGADLVGKVEAGIPEDDPRNPATIADNVGDNVGDVAGMGADLFGSYVATVLAAMVLGNYVIRDMIIANGSYSDGFGGFGPILLPLIIAGLGIIFSILGSFVVTLKSDNAKEAQVQKALNKGNWFSIVLTAIAGYFLVLYFLPPVLKMNFFGQGIKDVTSMHVYGAMIVGLLVGGLISYFTEYYTGLGKKPVLDIVKKSGTGDATNIIAGLSTGMISTFPSILLFASAIWASYTLAGFYGTALAASAMMATTAMQLAIDAFGPISDNAGGIAEMSELPKEVRERTDILDSVGNTTAATGKGFAIASAALTALALFAAFVTFTGIVEGTGKPEYSKCVDISTKAALREMVLPGALTIFFPIIITFLPMLFGIEKQTIAEMLGGYMAGVTVSGVIWAIFQNNAGGAWDNAKKSFEAGVMIDGKMTYKGSDAHKAAITGDTVGDPFKDTSGPSMNILIKLTCLIGLVLAPILGEGHSEMNVNNTSQIEQVGKNNITNSEQKEVTVKILDINGERTAKIITKSTVNGKTTVETKTLTGEAVDQYIDNN